MCCPGDSWFCWGHRHPWHQAGESGLCLVDAGPRAAGSRYQLDRQRREDCVLEGSILSLHLTTVSGTGVDSLGGARPGKGGGDTGSAPCCCVRSLPLWPTVTTGPVLWSFLLAQQRGRSQKEREEEMAQGRQGQAGARGPLCVVGRAEGAGGRT